LTASELAFAARVTPQTASTHLAKLTEAGLLVPIREGRHRYFRLASPKVVEMLDGIMAVALENRRAYRPLSRQARELSAARICYDHLAGRLSVDLAASLITREYIAVGDEAADITPAGTRFLAEFGIDLSALSSTRRPFCRLCLDWTERQPHIAGALGAALTKRCFDLGWTERMKHSSAVIVTASGKHGFRKTFGIRMLEKPRTASEVGSAARHSPLVVARHSRSGRGIRDVRAKAQWAEEHGFVWFSVMDHMIQIPRVGAPDESVLEGWTVLAGAGRRHQSYSSRHPLHRGALSQIPRISRRSRRASI